jgi:hypothetical protein
VCERRANLLVYSLSLHRHSYIGFILAFASSIHNKQIKSIKTGSLCNIIVEASTTSARRPPAKLNKNGQYITYSPITFTNFVLINLVSIFRCSSSSCNPVHVRHVDSSTLVFSLSSHRYTFLRLFFSFHFTHRCKSSIYLSFYRLVIDLFYTF